MHKSAFRSVRNRFALLSYPESVQTVKTGDRLVPLSPTVSVVPMMRGLFIGGFDPV